MDAETYFKLTDEIAAADTHAILERLRERIRQTDMNPLERQALERVLRSRADALRLVGAGGTKHRALLDRIYDAGGRLTLEAPADNADYPAFRDTVETLLTMTRYGYVMCEATTDPLRSGRTYLRVVATLTHVGREYLAGWRAGSEDRP